MSVPPISREESLIVSSSTSAPVLPGAEEFSGRRIHRPRLPALSIHPLRAA